MIIGIADAGDFLRQLKCVRSIESDANLIRRSFDNVHLRVTGIGILIPHINRHIALIANKPQFFGSVRGISIINVTDRVIQRVFPNGNRVVVRTVNVLHCERNVAVRRTCAEQTEIRFFIFFVQQSHIAAALDRRILYIVFLDIFSRIILFRIRIKIFERSRIAEFKRNLCRNIPPHISSIVIIPCDIIINRDSRFNGYFLPEFVFTRNGFYDNGFSAFIIAETVFFAGQRNRTVLTAHRVELQIGNFKIMLVAMRSATVAEIVAVGILMICFRGFVNRAARTFVPVLRFVSADYVIIMNVFTANVALSVSVVIRVIRFRRFVNRTARTFVPVLRFVFTDFGIFMIVRNGMLTNVALTAFIHVYVSGLRRLVDFAARTLFPVIIVVAVPFGITVLVRNRNGVIAFVALAVLVRVYVSGFRGLVDFAARTLFPVIIGVAAPFDITMLVLGRNRMIANVAFPVAVRVYVIRFRRLVDRIVVFAVIPMLRVVTADFGITVRVFARDERTRAKNAKRHTQNDEKSFLDVFHNLTLLFYFLRAKRL